MAGLNRSYQLAESLHQSFLGPSSNISKGELEELDINMTVSDGSGKKKIVATAIIDGEPLEQQFYQDPVSRNYCLTTNRSDGDPKFTRITPESTDDYLSVLLQSLFVQGLQKIINSRRGQS